MEEQKYAVEGFVKGCLKDPADETVVLPVVTGKNEVRHQDLLCPSGKKRMIRDRVCFGGT